MEFQLLGPVRARHDGTAVPLGRRRERCLLAVLLLEVGSVVPAERLIDLLWDGEPSPPSRVTPRPETAIKPVAIKPVAASRRGRRATDQRRPGHVAWSHAAGGVQRR